VALIGATFVVALWITVRIANAAIQDRDPRPRYLLLASLLLALEGSIAFTAALDGRYLGLSAEASPAPPAWRRYVSDGILPFIDVGLAVALVGTMVVALR
jgi:hypothetical protein